MSKATHRVAVVLFSLGAPDGDDAVRPFLFNVFSDPALLRLPGVLRWPVAWFIARKHTRGVQEIHHRIGGGSPLLENTEAQAAALEMALADLGDADIRVFIAMRYWYPMADETAQKVGDFDPDLVLLLPLHPQYSIATTASSVAAWHRSASVWRVAAPTRLLCCYPVDRGFVDASVHQIRPAYDRATASGRPRLLFSAHGVPERVARDGDPYQVQCGVSALAIADALAIEGLDWAISYQGRVGPLKWIGPSTEEEIERAGRDGVPIMVYPLSFVSERAETLVDIEDRYRALALARGVPYFESVPTVGTHPAFIAGLARLVRSAMDRPACKVANTDGDQTCPVTCSGCPWPRKDL